jgi:hypothetical protein
MYGLNYYGGTSQMENMKPICDQCYHNIGNQNMDQYMITNNMNGLMYLNKSYKETEYKPNRGRRLKRHEVLQQIINGDPNTLYFSTGPVDEKLYFEMMDLKYKNMIEEAKEQCGLLTSLNTKVN